MQAARGLHIWVFFLGKGDIFDPGSPKTLRFQEIRGEC